MSGRFHDFDAMWAEAAPKHADRPKVRVFGEDVFLPASIPARIVLKAIRAAEDGEDANRLLRPMEVYEQACALYTKERVEAWMDRGLTIAQLDELVAHGLGLYMAGRNDGDSSGDEGNETAPEEGAKREHPPSSKNGT